ncbi:MAG: pilus assembly protein TadG-related protein [Candidatus Limnocylindria bacterium]
MTAFYRDQAGSLALVTILLLPLLVVVTVGVLELGMARLVAERARLAADLATVVAVNDQDTAELARSGSLRLSADAASVARQHLALNLAPLADRLARSPDQIATSADVAVFPSGGGLDPRTGERYEGPTVRIELELPVRTPAFGVLLSRPVTGVRILSASSAR